MSGARFRGIAPGPTLQVYIGGESLAKCRDLFIQIYSMSFFVLETESCLFVLYFFLLCFLLLSFEEEQTMVLRWSCRLWYWDDNFFCILLLFVVLFRVFFVC